MLSGLNRNQCPNWLGIRNIDQRFGERHPTTQRPRLESVPARTSLSDPTLRFIPSPKPYVVLRCGPLTAVVVDNQAVDDEVLPGHRAGYSGLGVLRHERQPRNLFVPAYAGLNLNCHARGLCSGARGSG